MSAEGDFPFVVEQPCILAGVRWSPRSMRRRLDVLGDDVRTALSQAEDLQSVFDVVAETVRRLGFESCAYGVRMRLPYSRQKFMLISNYDQRWQDRYREAGYLQIDPTVAHGVRSTAPLVWSRELFRSTPKLWAEARAFDLQVGWAQSSFDASGSVGMLSLARSSQKLTRAELRAHEPEFCWLANAAHMALSAALRRTHGEPPPELSAREIEILQWMADGKTSEEIALLLSISVNTVNFHAKNVRLKLRSANKTSAVASAAGLGLLG